MFKTSRQTITWGDPQHLLFDHIFSLAAVAGFRGVEVAFGCQAELLPRLPAQLFNQMFRTGISAKR